MAIILIFVGEVIALCRSRGVYLLYLGERLAHPPEGHCHIIGRTLRLAHGMNQAVQLVVCNYYRHYFILFNFNIKLPFVFKESSKFPFPFFL